MNGLTSLIMNEDAVLIIDMAMAIVITDEATCSPGTIATHTDAEAIAKVTWMRRWLKNLLAGGATSALARGE